MPASPQHIIFCQHTVLKSLTRQKSWHWEVYYFHGYNVLCLKSSFVDIEISHNTPELSTVHLTVTIPGSQLSNNLSSNFLRCSHWHAISPCRLLDPELYTVQTFQVYSLKRDISFPERQMALPCVSGNGENSKAGRFGVIWKSLGNHIWWFEPRQKAPNKGFAEG